MRAIESIKHSLNSFDPAERRKAVEEIVDARRSGDWRPAPVRDWMNLHGHTFHSYNSEGWSPSRLVVEAVEAGLEIVGSVDFDVLDAMEEVFEASDILGIKAVVGLETRVFIPEYADRELNSPGEPGIAYFMAVGCFRRPDLGSRGEEILHRLKSLSDNRNREMTDRINRHLVEVQLDYDVEVLPLTPSNNPTERHLVEAYSRKGREVFADDPLRLVAFWADRFGMTADELAPHLGDENRFQELLRSKLMKKGGVGYASPDPYAFPSLEELIELALSMGALPAYAFLDGTTPGESDMGALLEFMDERGVCALNIIPDRNWNLSDPEAKKVKTAKLYEAVSAAKDLALPLCIGTEMNKKGLPFVDRFDAPELAPVVDEFRRGGRAIWGHTLLARTKGAGWTSDFARGRFGDSNLRRLDFYARIGEKTFPGLDSFHEFKTMDLDSLVKS